jgi:hypothetical protein
MNHSSEDEYNAYNQAQGEAEAQYNEEMDRQRHSSQYQNFFNFMSQEHSLTLTCEEMDEIIFESQRFVNEYKKTTKEP